ncbi:hypothetical protein [Sphingomonas sp. SRS2]|uniref:hypothetical protein n=1 Tax=Sphingomonas sp. SRS2 TaxID=133190 RepID=UPI00061846D6|nr:hypothetical protein [Sphingomonas sp. SRS2]KKC24798.1 hypothetical protein WP12_17565 [Sphingomonas sp. SRS2]
MMVSRNFAIMLAGMAALIGCGQTAQENAAEQLDNAAAQSDPAAADVLRNAADDLRDNASANAAVEAQNALQEAGEAQSGSPAPPSSTD